MSAVHEYVGGTCGSGFVPSAADMLGMSAVCGMKGVGVCNVFGLGWCRRCGG